MNRIPEPPQIQIANGMASKGDYVIYQKDPLYPETRPYPITRICLNGEVWTSGGKGYAKYFELVPLQQVMIYAISRAIAIK